MITFVENYEQTNIPFAFEGKYANCHAGAAQRAFCRANKYYLFKLSGRAMSLWCRHTHFQSAANNPGVVWHVDTDVIPSVRRLAAISNYVHDRQ